MKDTANCFLNGHLDRWADLGRMQESVFDECTEDHISKDIKKSKELIVLMNKKACLRN